MSATVPPLPGRPHEVPTAVTRAPVAAETVVHATEPYAGLATRTLAFAADAAVINVVGWFVALVVGLGLSLLNLPDSVKHVLVAIGAAVALGWTFAYFVFFWSTTGQTPGNRLMKIRVIDARTALPPRPARAFVRLIGVGISALLLCTGFLLILFDGRRRALHDRLVHTVVADVADEPTPIRSDVRPNQIRR